MAAAQVIMYVTAWCPYCARARAVLEGKGVDFQEIDVDAVPGAQADMVARCGRGSVPQIFIGAAHVGGCDDLLALDEAGRLDTLLNITGAS
jgi:glutaredoxin 3